MNGDKEVLMNLAEKINQEGIRQLGLSDIGRILGMTEAQVLHAKNRGKLRTKKVFVASVEDIEHFVSQYLIKDKGGKQRVALHPTSSK